MMKHYTFTLIAMILGFYAYAQGVQIEQVWENGQWKNVSRYTPTYAANNLAVQESLNEIWDDQVQAWQNHLHTTNTISAEILVTESLTQEWNAATSQWVNYQHQIRDYTQATHLTTQVWDGMDWQNATLISTESYIPNESTVLLYQIWNNGQWENDLRQSYNLYSEGNSEHIEQDWQNGEWINQVRLVTDDDVTIKYVWTDNQWEFATRSTNLMEGTTFTEIYDSLTQTWLPYSQMTVANEPIENNVLHIVTTQLYNDGVWVNSHRTITEATVLLGNPEASKPIAVIFPNPATETLHLQSYSGDYAIFTIDGREVGRGTANEHASIDVSGFASGVYVLKTSAKALRFVKQ